MAGPLLPNKFPCWCRAVYSWGGEGPRDLGFVEGDLIECLNAGDGQWWMGRLRRDKRMMGLFPSNFVAVLEDSFQPMSRSASPMPELPKSNGIDKQHDKKERAKSRKPFQGYKSAQVRQPSPQPLQSPSKPIPQYQPSYDASNPPSTVLWNQRPVSRGPSRSPSPLPHHDIGSSPPPPPPPHRSGVGGSFSRRTPSPQPARYDEPGYFGRTPSPHPPSVNGHTPPMIRDAMDDVMSSLDDMKMGGQQAGMDDQPLSPWSPEAFDNFRQPQHPPARPLTSLGLGAGGSNYSETRVNYSQRHNSPDRFQDGPPQLETYVQRMESRLRQMQEARERAPDEYGSDPPEPPPKNSPWSRPTSAMARRQRSMKRKSNYELGQREKLDRTYTTKTNSTNSSSGVQSVATNASAQTNMTSQSIFSTASGFSATSAGSLARKRMGSVRDRITNRPMTSAGIRSEGQWNNRPTTPADGFKDQGSRSGAKSAVGWDDDIRPLSSGGLGGFSTPKAKKQGFFKKMIDSAKTQAASVRSTIAVGPGLPNNSSSPTKMTGIAGGMAVLSPKKNQNTSNLAYGRDAAKEMGLMAGAASEWLMTRRDVNRSNTPGPSERQERADRCHMLDHPVICPVEELFTDRQGDENGDGHPIYQPFQLSNPSFSQVDKAARCISSLPHTITAAMLATGYVCRPYRSAVQRLRAIFTWCAERISWDDDGIFDRYDDGYIDTRRVIQTKRGSSREVSALVVEMCTAIGVHAEQVRGYLKSPGEDLDLDAVARPNHYWNAILVDNEWRIFDASIASPTNPRRAQYSSVSNNIAEAWYFLAQPSQICWTHVPCEEQQQHMVPPVSPDVLLALPGTCPPFSRLGLSMHAYDTSIIRLEELEVASLAINVPSDVEVVAEVEAKSFLKDQDGDVYEDTDNVTKKRALAQSSWFRQLPHTDLNQKRYIIKAVLPGDEGQGVLKIYAGKKGLMLSSRDIVHPLALAVPLYHTGKNPVFDFVKRHPTPHATRHDLYIVQPQCHRLGIGETYVFCIRQHPSSTSSSSSTPTTEPNGFDLRPISPNPTLRPTSAMSMSSSQTGSQPSSHPSDPTTHNPSVPGVKLKEKPAKLAIQSPSGKIIRLNRKPDSEHKNSATRDVDGEVPGSTWEAVVKVSERGVWRALVLADRTARWCVWGEWECV